MNRFNLIGWYCLIRDVLGIALLIATIFIFIPGFIYYFIAR